MKATPPEAPIRIEQVLAMDLEPALRRRALEVVAQGPDATTWLALLDHLLLYAGAALVLAGIVYFFAFNWAGLPRFAKFGLAGSGLCAAAVLAWIAGLERLPGRIALASACVLVGVFLAVLGQAYHTGADPFELFRAWSLLILPWVFLARLQGLWAFWLLLLNLWLAFWFAQTDPDALSSLWGAFTALNLGAWLVREALQDRLSWTGGRWLPRLLVVPAMAAPMAMSLAWAAEPFRSRYAYLLPQVLSLALILALVGLFRKWRRDLFMVTLGLAAAIALATNFLTNLLLVLNPGSQGCAILLVVGLALAAQVGGAAVWLRHLHRGRP